MDNYFWIVVLYFLAIVLWVVVIYFLGLRIRDGFDVAIFITPILIFIIAMVNLGKPLSKENQNFIFVQNYSSSFSVILMPILIFLADQEFDTGLLMTILFATAFGLYAFLDLWVSDATFDLAKHFKSIFQTISIALILYSLKLFFHDRVRDKKLRQQTTFVA